MIDAAMRKHNRNASLISIALGTIALVGYADGMIRDFREDTMKVGLIGLGRMGEGMSRRMLKAGIEVWGYRRNYAKG